MLSTWCKTKVKLGTEKMPVPNSSDTNDCCIKTRPVPLRTKENRKQDNFKLKWKFLSWTHLFNAHLSWFSPFGCVRGTLSRAERLTWKYFKLLQITRTGRVHVDAHVVPDSLSLSKYCHCTLFQEWENTNRELDKNI